MCYNCGCGMPDNDGGSAKNIVDKTFVEAAKAAGQSVEEAKKNTLELLKKTLSESKNNCFGGDRTKFPYKVLPGPVCPVKADLEGNLDVGYNLRRGLGRSPNETLNDTL